MDTYFNIRYEFEPRMVHEAIAERLRLAGSDYISVADGVVLNEVKRNPQYREIVNGGMFSICDSSYVPLYIRWIYGRRVEQYCGSQIFEDIVRSRRYRMIFLGAGAEVLDGLRRRLTVLNPDVGQMKFIELPFCEVEKFDYKSIAKTIEDDGADIIWVALGAPKQEQFMSRLKPHLGHGVMIAVGAVFKFYSGTGINRAPAWMVRNHLEFVYRIFSEPRKQIKRCWAIISTLPSLLISEYRRKKSAEQQKSQTA